MAVEVLAWRTVCVRMTPLSMAMGIIAVAVAVAVATAAADVQALAEAVDAALDADDEETADALQEEGEHLGEQLQALEDGLQDYSPNVKAAAGAIVTIDRNGETVIHRGLMREAEAKALRTLERLRQGLDRKSVV